jgi:hypothetical protein
VPARWARLQATAYIGVDQVPSSGRTWGDVLRALYLALGIAPCRRLPASRQILAQEKEWSRAGCT